MVHAAGTAGTAGTRNIGSGYKTPSQDMFVFLIRGPRLR